MVKHILVTSQNVRAKGPVGTQSEIGYASPAPEFWTRRGVGGPFFWSKSACVSIFVLLNSGVVSVCMRLKSLRFWADAMNDWSPPVADLEWETASR